MELPSSLNKLVRDLSSLPGIGSKSAKRMAFHILNQSPQYSQNLSASILNCKESIQECEQCFYYSESTVCQICSSPKRDESIICIVEKASDVIAFENSSSFKGVYHVLGGHISPLDGIGPDDIHIPELLKRIDEQTSEVILALNSNMDSEATILFIEQALQKLENEKGYNLKKSRLARGIPVGSELEFVDEMTISKAFEGRIQL